MVDELMVIRKKIDEGDHFTLKEFQFLCDIINLVMDKKEYMDIFFKDRGYKNSEEYYYELKKSQRGSSREYKLFDSSTRGALLGLSLAVVEGLSGKNTQITLLEEVCENLANIRKDIYSNQV